MKKLKLGVVPIKRTFLPMAAAVAQKNAFMPVIRQIKRDWVEIVDVDELTENGIAFTYEVIAPIVQKLQDAKIDALFLPFCDFGEESVAAGIASALKVPTLVWGPRDTEPNSDVTRGRDTQCGIIAATKVLARCGVTYSYMDDFHFHLLRHTYTTNLLSHGAAPKDVQELLGHSDVSTTMNIYAHATREAKRTSARLLDKVVGTA